MVALSDCSKRQIIDQKIRQVLLTGLERSGRLHCNAKHKVEGGFFEADTSFHNSNITLTLEEVAPYMGSSVCMYKCLCVLANCGGG